MARNKNPRGDNLNNKLCHLAHAWWGNRLDKDWIPRTREQNQAILNDVGLTDGFWNLSATNPDA